MRTIIKTPKRTDMLFKNNKEDNKNWNKENKPKITKQRKNHEYENSIEQKAKAALNHLK